MKKKSHPYETLPEENFWKTAVALKSPFQINGIYKKKFDLTENTRIAAAGSCFAQHIARRLRASGFNYLDIEPRPVLLPEHLANQYGYEIYSARYGNIYTSRQMLQLLQRALGIFSPLEGAWQNEGRYYDPFRPTIEPCGFGSLEELEACRKSHLESVVSLFKRTDLFIFTFGLTEAWMSREDGAIYPVCPGTAAGTFDTEKYEFKNFSFTENMKDMVEFIHLARSLRVGMRFLFTVSPVPLVATASSNHVLVATTHSKSILRAVAGELCNRFPFVDYFPSYELINSAPMRGMFFDPNMRTVCAQGVDFVMDHFFYAHPPIKAILGDAPHEPIIERDAVCDEIILEADRIS